MRDPDNASAALLSASAQGARIGEAEALACLESAPLDALMGAAAALTQAGFGTHVTYSRKVFIPLTQLCRDVCHYCTFARSPRRLAAAYLPLDEVRRIALAGAAAGCKEALFTLGDRPELRYAAARRGLAQVGADSTLEYLQRAAQVVLADTGLLPHLNPGVMSREELSRLRPVAASMGLMLESASTRLCERGEAHFGSPDKHPERRLQTLRDAGELDIAMTTGLLVGIGETRRERIEALLALRALHEQFGHLQELIIQNFKPKPGTRMAAASAAPLHEQLWTIAVARLLFGPAMSIQAPPNLQPDALASLIGAGVNDWGGVSPVTPDHVNPEAPWPHLSALAASTAQAGRLLLERLALVPSYARDPARWTDPGLTPRVRKLCDARGYARPDAWYAGSGTSVPAAAADWVAGTHAAGVHAAGAGPPRAATGLQRGGLAGILAAAAQGEQLSEQAIVRLFDAEGRDFEAVLQAADALRARTVGDVVTYVVNRNINYTNICLYHCGF
ncbi:MAG: 7,8-didemethyl-8-hydroxy-5-deazariboflavin synthase CofG, partial [Steroidobacteraceae bacterium]